MNCYIVSYDLRREEGDQTSYNALYKKIKEYGTWAHITESTWAILASEKAAQIRDNLLQVLDDDDGLFVIKSGHAAAWVNVDCSNKWLKKNL